MSPRGRDLLCLLILLLACLIVRIPSLDRIALNPDESQYEATASYLLATGASPFAFPYGTVTTFALYKSVAGLFGPYAMFQMRLLVLAISIAMTLMLYGILRKEGGRIGALLAGLLFAHYNLFFEGLSANREWFSGVLLLLGVYLYSLTSSRKGKAESWLLVAAGAACGGALWFKLQAAYLLLPIPLLLLCRLRWRAAFYYSIGAAGSFALHFLPFLAAGTLPKYLESLTTRWTSYVLGNEAAVPASAAQGGMEQLAARFYADLPWNSLLLVAYLMALILLLGHIPAIAKRFKKELPLLQSPMALLFVFYLIAAVGAVRMGNLFFDHYYLYMLPAVAALFGYFAQLFLACRNGSKVLGALGLLVVALLVGSRLASLKIVGLKALAAHWEHFAFPLLYLLIGAGLLGFIAWRPWRNIPTAVVLLLCLETGGLMLGAQELKRPASLPYHRDLFSDLARHIEMQASPGDRLFVWGWLPEIYSVTRLEAASHFAITQYVVNDYQSSPAEPALDMYFADQLMGDLEERKPRFIVDTWRRSWTMEGNADPRLYRLELYPEFGLRAYIDRHYEHVGRFDGCELYVRD